MKAFVFSIGEPTTDLAIWSLERLGIDVTLIQDPKTSLWDKMKFLYNAVDEDFIRMDADFIANKNTPLIEPKDNCWWHQSYNFDWYRLDVGVGGLNWIKKEALHYLREHIDEARDDSRPETMMWRLKEFHNPRRCEIANIVTGIHGYKQNDLERVKKQKAERNQDYDWPLIERINQL